MISGPSFVTILIPPQSSVKSPPSSLSSPGSVFNLVTTAAMITTSTVVPEPVENSTTPWSPVYPDPEKCNYFISNKNTTEYFRFSNPYGGIPQVLHLFRSYYAYSPGTVLQLFRRYRTTPNPQV
jgi:hypothetical protein